MASFKKHSKHEDESDYESEESEKDFELSETSEESELGDVNDENNDGDGKDKDVSDDESAEDVFDEEDIDKSEMGPTKHISQPSCIYKVKSKKKHFDKNEILNEIDLPESDIKNREIIVPPEERITRPILTKYERVRVIGDRCEQITRGAKVMLKNYEGLTPREITELELKNKTIPIIIKRQLPSGKIERWSVNELTVVN